MSIQIEASYAKKLGLPNFSSHSYMVTVRAEVTSLRRLEAESARLYRLLQDSVDKQVEQVGFLPDATKYGLLAADPPTANGAPAANGRSPNGHSVKGPSLASFPDPDAWACSDRQKALILQLAKQAELSAAALDAVADRLYQRPAPALDKKQASALISELLAQTGRPQIRIAPKHSVAPASQS
jgi:hypothetical protein